MKETEFTVEILYKGRWIERGIEHLSKGDLFRLRDEMGELEEDGLIWKAMKRPRRVGEKWVIDHREGGRWRWNVLWNAQGQSKEGIRDSIDRHR